MKRTQLQLTEPVYEALRRRAHGRKTSVAGVVREAIQQYLAVRPQQGPTTGNGKLPPGFSWVGIGASRAESGRPVSVHHDEYLARALSRELRARVRP
jgi:hypothetical protein